jgi:hypothetical protein
MGGILRLTASGVAALVLSFGAMSCGKGNLATRHPGELTVAEQADKLCFDFVSQLKAAMFEGASQVGTPSLRLGLHRSLELAEKDSLEQDALKSAVVTISILREARKVRVPSFARPSDVVYEQALERSAQGYRSFARRIRGEPARPNEFSRNAKAYLLPERSAFRACEATVGVLHRGHGQRIG